MTATLTSTTLMTQQNTPNNQLSTVGDLEPWQEPVECAKCHDVIWSRWQGEFVWCSCKAIAVDQTRHYSGYIGEKENFLFHEKDSFIFKEPT